MKKIVALGGSNSKSSINKTLATYAANKVNDAEVVVADLKELDLPFYGIDAENEDGIPDNAYKLNEMINDADGLVISLAEHNGTYSTAFKNAFDWISRIEQKVWRNKPMLLMATSPGGRGGQGVLQFAKTSFPYQGANVVADFSLPSFYENFSEEGIKNLDLEKSLKEKVEIFSEAI